MCILTFHGRTKPYDNRLDDACQQIDRLSPPTNERTTYPRGVIGNISDSDSEDAKFNPGSNPGEGAIVEVMKICSACKFSKPLVDFNKKAASKDGLQPHCRVCSKSRYKDRYDNLPSEKQRLIKRNAEQRERTRAYIREAKSVPCTDCGNSYPYYVMDFDHLGYKEFNVGNAVYSNLPLKRVIEEITKCEVVCSNCHRIRTHERGTHSGIV